MPYQNHISSSSRVITSRGDHYFVITAEDSETSTMVKKTIERSRQVIQMKAAVMMKRVQVEMILMLQMMRMMMIITI